MGIMIGTAGWSIPRQNAEAFPQVGTALERYSAVFPVTEINSSFHRPHKRSTWDRWGDSVPPGFRFSAKIPKEITHQQKLVDCSDALQSFIAAADGLGEKLAILLVQLPPRLSFDEAVAAQFFTELGTRTPAMVACDARNPAWFSDEADALLNELRVARVVADPPICERARSPGGWTGLTYVRLHGSPMMYRSSYADRIETLAERLHEYGADEREVWCIFDNTASSAAAGDAITLKSATMSELT
jgi:uncharacterized protein YecE (DUF72 family)